MKQQRINSYYDESFYFNISEGSYRSAQQVVPLIMQYLRPRSVVDVGCGTGAWLKVFQELGADVKGIDGDYVDRKQFMIAPEAFYPMNLEKSIELQERFDLVMSLEVVEHLSEARGTSFVEDLTKLGDIVLFSAAVPLQGGTNHINERKLSDWKRIFESFQYSFIDCIRPLIWNNEAIELYYRQNIVLFVKQDVLKNMGGGMRKLQIENINNMVDVIHPGIYEQKARLLKESVMLRCMFKTIVKRICPESVLDFWRRYRDRNSKQA